MGKQNAPIDTPLHHHSHNEITDHNDGAYDHREGVTLHIARLQQSQKTADPPEQGCHAVDRAVNDYLIKKVLTYSAKPEKKTHDGCAIDLIHEVLVINNAVQTGEFFHEALWYFRVFNIEPVSDVYADERDHNREDHQHHLSRCLIIAP